jgi:hypothetical protein
VFSYQTPRGDAKKIDVNDPSADLSKADLPEQTVEFVRLYLGDGNKFNHPSDLLEMRCQLKKDPSGNQGGRGAGRAGQPQGEQGGTEGGQPAAEGASAQAGEAGSSDSQAGKGATESKSRKGGRSRRGSQGRQGAQGGSGQSGQGDGSPAAPKAGDWIESGVGAEELPTVMEKLSAGPISERTAGLVNVNTAPAGVLAILPGMSADLARKVTDVRVGLSGETKANLAWLYTQGALDADTFKAVAPLLTTRSLQFHVRCVGFGSPVGRYRILEAVLDLAGPAPRILDLRELTRLGLPFAVETDQTER